MAAGSRGGYGGTASGKTVAQITKDLQAADRSFVGPRKTGAQINPAGSGGAGHITLKVDLGPVIDRIKEVYDRFGKNVAQRALSNALNHESSIFFTSVKRHIAAQTSVPYGKVSSMLREKKATPGRLIYRIDAAGSPLPLSQFMVGQKRGVGSLPHKRGPVPIARVKVWRKQRTLGRKGHEGLVLGGGIYKRVGKGRKDLKLLWGPIVPKEMLRPDDETFKYIQKEMPGRVHRRILHELKRAFPA